MFKKIWFSSKPKSSLIVNYIQSSADVNLFFMKKNKFYSLIIDLKKSQNEIILDCSSTCRNEIRRGEKIGIEFKIGLPTVDDGYFIDEFLKEKGLGEFNKKYIQDLESMVCLVELNGVRLATHLYKICAEIGRARLVYSAVAPSDIDIINTGISSQRVIGIANRFLHYSSIMYFKDNGFSVYDFGGLGLDESNLKIKGINDFKKSFGGIRSIEYNYTPYAIVWIKWLVKKYIL